MEARDRADATRADSPLTCDASYVRIDTSLLDAEGVAEACLAAVARSGAGGPGAGGPETPPASK